MNNSTSSNPDPTTTLTVQDVIDGTEITLERLNALFVAIWRMVDYHQNTVPTNFYWRSDVG